MLKRHAFRLLLIAAVLGAAALAGAHDGDHTLPKKPAAAASADAANANTSASANPAATLGKPETAKWTPTTYEAAASEANKRVLASGKVKTITGEVVDVSCYMQLGKRGEAHIDCGSKCIRNGAPIGLVDDDEDLYILFAEEHHPRRDGQVDLKKTFLPLLAKYVTVTGMMTEMKGYKALFVQAAELGKLDATKTPAGKK
jgi:hypothetical protein